MANEIVRERSEVAIYKKKLRSTVERAVHMLRNLGMSYEDIAYILGLRESTVRSAEKKEEEYRII